MQIALWTIALWSKLRAILQTPGIALQYTFCQFLTPISSSFVRNPGVVVAVLIHCYSSLPPVVAITPLLWRWGQVESPSSSGPLLHQGERHTLCGGYVNRGDSYRTGGSFGIVPVYCFITSDRLAEIGNPKRRSFE